MLQKISQLVDRISASNQSGKINLFMIAKMDELTDKWSLIISTSWTTDEDSKTKVFDLIWEFITTEFDEKERNLIARIGVADNEAYLIRQILTYLDTIPSFEDFNIERPLKLGNFKANGNIIHEAYLFVWNRSERTYSTIN